MKFSSLFQLVIIAAIGLGAASCTVLKPYQREIHASRAMKTDDDKLGQKIDSHVEEYREGSVGGSGVGGGGCGCN